MRLRAVPQSIAACAASTATALGGRFISGSKTSIASASSISSQKSSV